MKVMNKLLDFEKQIREVLSRFNVAFGEPNPAHLWRTGIIERTGFLDSGHTIEYSFHGSGCTVVINGKIVSFDFDQDGKYCYTAFKFGLFLGDELEDDQQLANSFVKLLSEGVLIYIPGHGVRLA